MWEKHLCRKTVVAALGQTYRSTQNFILDAYNRLVDTNRDWIPLGSVGYADRLPGPIIAVTTVSSGCGDYKPNIDTLMEKVQAQQYKVLISQFSSRHHSLFTGTGLLTSDEIEERKRVDQQIKQRMRGFRDNTSHRSDNTFEVNKFEISDMDLTDVTLHEAVTPQPSK